MAYSYPVSIATQIIVTTRLTGMMARTMRVNFHCTAKATTKAETKVDRAAMVMPNFSDIPWLIRFPFVVICPGIDDDGESKKATS